MKRPQWVIVVIFSIVPFARSCSGIALAAPAPAEVYALSDLGIYSHSANAQSSGDLVVSGQNDIGDIVGAKIKSAANDNWELVAWHLGKMVGIPTPSKYTIANANTVAPAGINDSDLIAASVDTSSGTAAMVIDPAHGQPKWTELPSHMRKHGLAATTSGISDSGIVVGNDQGLAALWAPITGGYSETTFPTGEEFTGVDAAGRPLGTALRGKGIIGATLWRLNHIGVRLDNPVLPSTPAGCVSTYTEIPRAARDVTQSDGTVDVFVAGAASATTDCAGKTTSTTTAKLWEIDLNDGHVTHRSLPESISTSGGSCTDALSINSSGTVLAVCQGQYYLWSAGEAVSLSSRLQPGDQANWVLDPGTSVTTQMNDRGDIVAAASGPDALVHDVLLTLVANPGPLHGVVFANNFDGQATGTLLTGSAQNLFTQAAPSGITVGTDYANSKPNDLRVQVGGVASDFAIKYYPTTYPTHTVAFRLLLGPGFTEGSSGYTEISGTETGSTSSKDGLVQVVLQSNLLLVLTYIDSSGSQHYIYTNANLQPSHSYAIAYSEAANGPDSGSLTLSVNGIQLVDATKLNLGSTGVGLFKVGNVYTPQNSGSGFMYYDDVQTSTGGA